MSLMLLNLVQLLLQKQLNQEFLIFILSHLDFHSRVRYRTDGILKEQEHFAKFLTLKLWSSCNSF